MAVIKSVSPPEPASGRPRSVISAEVAEASQEAKHKVEEAKKTAVGILDEAQRQKERVLEEFRAVGREEGMARATAEIARAKVQAGQMLRQAEQDILSLALKVAERIIGRDLERDPELVVEICANAIENLRQARQLTVRIHPRDGAILRANKPRLMDLIARKVDISIKDDPEVEMGGCILQTEFGTLDAQLSTQLAMLSNVLLDDGSKKGD